MSSLPKRKRSDTIDTADEIRTPRSRGVSSFFAESARRLFGFKTPSESPSGSDDDNGANGLITASPDPTLEVYAPPPSMPLYPSIPEPSPKRQRMTPVATPSKQVSNPVRPSTARRIEARPLALTRAPAPPSATTGRPVTDGLYLEGNISKEKAAEYMEWIQQHLGEDVELEWRVLDGSGFPGLLKEFKASKQLGNRVIPTPKKPENVPLRPRKRPYAPKYPVPVSLRSVEIQTTPPPSPPAVVQTPAQKEREASPANPIELVSSPRAVQTINLDKPKLGDNLSFDNVLTEAFRLPSKTQWKSHTIDKTETWPTPSKYVPTSTLQDGR